MCGSSTGRSRAEVALNRVKGMPFPWSLNPYMGCAHRCTFCYVRAFERRADRPSGDAYGALDPRQGERRRGAARRARDGARGSGRASSIGAATDPYQPAEGRYRLTRACLEALAGRANPFHVITRGPMIVRDVDVLAEAARRARVAVSFSIPTLDEDVWRKPSRERRRRASGSGLSAARRRGGIDAGVALAPDPAGHLRPARAARGCDRGGARGRRAAHLWASVLHLKPGTREHFLATASPATGPSASTEYEQLYGSGAYLPARESLAVRRLVARLRSEAGPVHVPAPRLRPERAPEQLVLGLE